MKPDELFDRIPVVVFEDGKQVERELRDYYHGHIIVAYTPKDLAPDYKGFVITWNLEAYELLGTDEIVSHIKANFLKDKIDINDKEWIVIDKEKFEEYNNGNNI